MAGRGVVAPFNELVLAPRNGRKRIFGDNDTSLDLQIVSASAVITYDAAVPLDSSCDSESCVPETQSL